MLTATERNRMYQTAVEQLDVVLIRAIRDVHFNLAIRRHDDGAKDCARALFRLAADRLDTRAGLTVQPQQAA